MSKYGPRVYTSDLINTKNHWAVGVIWNREGSKGVYKIERTDRRVRRKTA